MGVYIKGVEMPRSCFYCPFQHKNTTKCLITHKYYNWGLTTPPSDCPLVPVPPHGRLIDAEWLKQLYDDPAYGEDVSRYHVVIPVILANIDDAPTIIEAEEGE